MTVHISPLAQAAVQGILGQAEKGSCTTQCAQQNWQILPQNARFHWHLLWHGYIFLNHFNQFPL